MKPKLSLHQHLKAVPFSYVMYEKWEQSQYFTLTMIFISTGKEFKLQTTYDYQMAVFSRARRIPPWPIIHEVIKLRMMKKMITSKIVKEYIQELKTTKNGN